MTSSSYLLSENMADDFMSQPMSNPTPFCLPQEAEYSSDSENSGSYDLDTAELDAYIPTTADIIDLINTFDQQELAYTAESYKFYSALRESRLVSNKLCEGEALMRTVQRRIFHYARREMQARRDELYGTEHLWWLRGNRGRLGLNVPRLTCPVGETNLPKGVEEPPPFLIKTAEAVAEELEREKQREELESVVEAAKSVARDLRGHAERFGQEEGGVGEAALGLAGALRRDAEGARRKEDLEGVVVEARGYVDVLRRQMLEVEWARGMRGCMGKGELDTGLEIV